MTITTNPNNYENYQIRFEQTGNEMILQAKLAEHREYEKFIANIIRYKSDTRRFFESLETDLNNPDISIETTIKKGFQNILKTMPTDPTQTFEALALLNEFTDNNGYLNPNEWIANIAPTSINFQNLANAVYAGFINYGVEDTQPIGTQRQINLSIMRINRDRTLNNVGVKNIEIDVDDITKQTNRLANTFPIQAQFQDTFNEVVITIDVNAFPQNSRVQALFVITDTESPIITPDYVFFGEIDNRAYKELILFY